MAFADLLYAETHELLNSKVFALNSTTVQVRIFLEWNGVPAVNLTVNKGVPTFGKVPSQLVTHIRYVKGYRTGHNHKSSVIAHPEFMYHGRHQTQDAPGSLEAFQGCPVFIKPVEYFRVDWIARNHALHVPHLTGFGWKVTLIFMIHLAELRADRIAPIRVLAIKEQTTAHYFKALVRRNWLPD